ARGARTRAIRSARSHTSAPSKPGAAPSRLLDPGSRLDFPRMRRRGATLAALPAKQSQFYDFFGSVSGRREGMRRERRSTVVVETVKFSRHAQPPCAVAAPSIMFNDYSLL